MSAFVRKSSAIAALSVGRAFAAEDAMKLTIVNGCSAYDGAIWIAHTVAGAVGPDPQDVKIVPGSSAQFHTMDGKTPLAATRFWPKFGCDPATGGNCDVGDSGGPGEKCVKKAAGKPDDYSNCAPPLDTKIEATFAVPGGPTQDVIDMSLVDGYTLPFKFETTGGSCTRAGEAFEGMDCSGLSLRDCPASDTLNGKNVSLQALNPKTGKLAGCFSPCMKLTDDKWNPNPVAPDSAEAGPYCCAGDFASPGACNSADKVLKTKYLAEAKKACPAAYGYAFDDKASTIACDTSTQYKVTFYCPVTEGEASTSEAALIV